MTKKSEDRGGNRPSRWAVSALAVMLGFAALLGVAGTYDVLSGPWAGEKTPFLAKNLFLVLVGIGGLLWLKPWIRRKAEDDPVSPATRRTNNLFALSGGVGALATLVLMISVRGSGHPVEVISNSPIPVRIAVIATVFWLVAHVIGWWWYFSADEHERRANDIGFLAGGGLFMGATPIWWVGARAGLLPPPDAMILWLATVLVMTIGWAWYRSR